MLTYKTFSTFLLFSFLSCVALSAQTIENSAGNSFEYQNETYRFQEMDEIFNKNAEANSHYLLAKKQLKNSKTWGYTSLGSLAFGGILLASSPPAKNIAEAFSAGRVLSVLAVAVVFPSTGTVGIIKYANGNKSRRLAVSTFNESYSTQLPKQKAVELSIVGRSNGLGLQLNF